ncbi:MAG: hypothetical protein GY839_11870 [candidate division Zixibacteria bacterium]|nr:hypothetical protein [candidate division Zixibacteria bacterium]
MIDDNALTITQYAHPSFPFPDDEYYWRVKAGDGVIWTEWSEAWSFFIDTRLPSGAVCSSPDSMGNIFPVSWTAGTDPSPSSGIVAYNIYVSENDSQNYEIWLEHYQVGLMVLFRDGQHGHIYYFEAIAVDSAGNYEEVTFTPECSTYVDTSFEGYQCEYMPGDVNMYNGIWPPAVIGADVTYLVNYFRSHPSGQTCILAGFWCSADANGDCIIVGSDVTKLVNYFRGQTELSYCIDYEPAWHDAVELPPSPPESWPNCEGNGNVR